MKVSFKLALDLSKSQVKALKRHGIVMGLDHDDPAGRTLIKRVLAKIVDDGVSSIFLVAPFPVTTDPEGAYEEVAAFGCSGPPGSAPVEDDPPKPPQPRRVRRPRPDSNQAEAS